MIEFDRPEVEAGGVVAGTVTWPRPQEAPSNPVAWLVWRLAILDHARIDFDGGSAIEDYTVVEMLRLAAGSAFRFTLPAAGPVSYDGKLFRVFWEVVAGTESPSAGADVMTHGAFRVVVRQGER